MGLRDVASTDSVVDKLLNSMPGMKAVGSIIRSSRENLVTRLYKYGG